MKVLLTAHQFFPQYTAGTEVAACSTGVEMLARGHEVHVLTVDPSKSNDTSEIRSRDYEYRGLKIHALELPDREHRPKLDAIKDEYDYPLVASHVREYLRTVMPDVVHMFHTARLSSSVIDVYKELNVPLVFTSTDFWAICVRNTLSKPSGELSEGPDDISSNCLECRRVERLLPRKYLPKTEDKKTFYRTIAERALEKRQEEHPNMARVRLMLARTETLKERFNSVDAILAPTRIMRQMLVENGIESGLVSVSPYGMDLSRFDNFERPAPIPGKLRIGYMGQLNRPKGVQVLIEAFKKLPERDSITLRISGDLKKQSADYSREIYEVAAGNPRINFAGRYPNEKVARELKKIDVLVVPSTWYENTPLVIYEAFASGIPVIATNLGGMAEVVHHGKNGFVFGVSDSDELASYLMRLLEEPGLLEELGRNAGNVRRVQDSVDEALALYERLREEKKSTPIIPIGSISSQEKPSPERPDVDIDSVGGMPVFFVVGRAKSGTSWMRRVLNSHPEILCKGEGIFFGRGADLGQQRGLMTPTSLQGALADSGTLKTWIEKRPMWTEGREADEHLVNLTKLAVQYFFREQLRASNPSKRIVGDKTPLITDRDMHEIHSVFPEAKVIHVIRDGRDAAVSVAHHVWNRSTDAGGHLEADQEILRKRDAYRADPEAFIASGESIFADGQLEWHAKDWVRLVGETVLRGPKVLGGNYTEVRYETMLAEPEEELRRLLRFLGVEVRDQVVSRCIERNSFDRKTQRKPGQEDSTAFMRKGIAGDWKNVFTEEDRRVFKKEAGDLLIELGYEEDGNW